MDKIKVTDVAVSIEKYVKTNITDKYVSHLCTMPDCDLIIHHLRQLENRSKEFHNPSFVVLVVGPVKSGKSTFVNLVARNYVSPTHFLECTVRPSLISSDKRDSLTVYRSTNPEHKEEQINNILDSINGLSDIEDIVDVRKEDFEYSEENVDRYIKLDTISVANDDILLTSIKTHGGKLLQDHVYLVDMAGFDGANVNFESPAYKAIIERADLIVFVQSSNSAISKVSASFFELLQTKNCTVPVCLVHNVFESAYWRDEASKRKDIEEQKEYAVSQINTKYKLALDSNYAFNLNLRKVYDWNKGRYVVEAKEALEKENRCFEESEEAMYELFQKRESIRLVNCVSRTKIQRDVLLDEINKLVEKLDADLSTYNSIETSFDVLRKDQIKDLFDTSLSKEEIFSVVQNEYNIIKRELSTKDDTAKFRTETAREYVNRLLTKIQIGTTKLLNQHRKEMTCIRNCEEVQLWITSIINNAAQYVSGQVVAVECNVEDVDLQLDIEINIEDLVPHKQAWFKHTLDELYKYLNFVVDSFCGFNSGVSDVKGYIENSLYSQLLAIMTDTKRDIYNNLIIDINKENERLKELSLKSIIKDYSAFQQQYNVLNDLKMDVFSLNIKTDE